MQPYTIWIESEGSELGQWPAYVNEYDCNSDVIVTFADRSRWVTTCVTYLNIMTLADKNRVTGENMSGAYVWVSNMLLVDQITRPRIEQVVAHLIEEGSFETIFTRLQEEEAKG